MRGSQETINALSLLCFKHQYFSYRLTTDFLYTYSHYYDLVNNVSDFLFRA